MICHEFKGGIGTSSRLVTTGYGQYTVGVLVQANYGKRYLLRVDGVPIGQMLGGSPEPIFEPGNNPAEGGSIIIVVATDAPLLPGQCTRLAKRAALGLARVGGLGFNGSGDIFLAFSTGNHLPITANAPLDLKMLPHDHLNPFFEATAEAVEESILNALTSAETMTGWQQRVIQALPHDELQRIMAKQVKP
jgi:D-aminopeptidase